MDAALDLLPPHARFALAYAPAIEKPRQLALLALDARMAGLARGATEPTLVQLRMAWWRDLLGKPPAGWPKGDPVVDALLTGGGSPALTPLVDGWEALATSDADIREAAEAFVEGRALAWSSLAGDDSGLAEKIRESAQVWALGDLAAHLTDETELRIVLGYESWTTAGRLPREFRALAILSELGRRALARGGGPLLSGPRDLLIATRLGISGR